MINKLLTLPNFITFTRLLLSWPLAYSIYHSYFYSTFTIGLIAILSDYLDGYLSRKLNQHSTFGKVLDPIADATIVLFTLVALYLKNNIPLWYIQLIIIRYTIIAIILLIYRVRTNITPSSIPSGKYSMGLLAITLFFSWQQALFPYSYLTCLYLSAILLIISMLNYIYTFCYSL